MIIYLPFIYDVVNVERFTKSLPKFIYIVYEVFSKIWLEFTNGWFTINLLYISGVRLPLFIYQNLVNEQPYDSEHFTFSSTKNIVKSFLEIHVAKVERSSLDTRYETVFEEELMNHQQLIMC